jgi:hypothetical protein
MDENLRRALGLAVQILDEMPTEFRPANNIKEMRGILAGRSSGRDDILLTQAVATALAFRAVSAMRAKRDLSRPSGLSGLDYRLKEFGDLFEMAARCSPSMLGMYFDQACGKLAPSRA